MRFKLLGKTAALFFSLILIFNFSVSADVKLPSVINENMVLQQGMKVPVWGWADPGEKVSVEFAGSFYTVSADANGAWKVNLKSMKAGGPYEMKITGKNKITLGNILIGEVWICSGQSNMEFKVSSAINSDKEIAGANYPNIRCFTVKRNVSPDPLKDCSGSWSVCSPATVGSFTAVGYFFGRELMKDLNVPVGLIHTSWGGTPAEVWLSLDGIKSEGSFNVLLDRWKTIIEGKPQAIVDYYRVEGDKSKTPKPESPVELTPWWPCIPSWVYNAMLAPVIPYGIKGAIWYQGESNDSRAYQYRRLFPAMINNWREIWGEGKFPFFFVQLANFKDTAPEPVESNWAELREAQTMTLSLPKTGMAVAIDIGEGKDIHPKNKQDVGKRLELNALKVAYSKKVVNSGPMYKSMKIKDGKVYLTFNYAGSGLMTKNGESLKGFAIAGADKKFVWAKAEISGDKVVVWSDKVTGPVAVRYAWADNPECNLYNKEGLPASPFRTDEWQGITFGKE